MTTENNDLEILRETTSKMLLAVLWVHVPVAMLIGLLRGNDWMMPVALIVAMALAATLSWRAANNALSTRLVIAVALMGDVSLFVYLLSGHPWQIDMHMYFFAALACLVAYCDYRPIIAGTVAVALHHLVLHFALPAAIYPGGADLGRVRLRGGPARDRRGEVGQVVPDVANSLGPPEILVNVAGSFRMPCMTPMVS